MIIDNGDTITQRTWEFINNIVLTWGRLKSQDIDNNSVRCFGCFIVNDKAKVFVGNIKWYLLVIYFNGLYFMIADVFIFVYIRLSVLFFVKFLKDNFICSTCLGKLLLINVCFMWLNSLSNKVPEEEIILTQYFL